MDDLDIYGDLENFDAGVELEKNNVELKDLRTKCDSLRVQMEALQQQVIRLEERNEAMKFNFNSLLLTARKEMARKDSLIQDLRREKDNIAFRRDPSQSNRPPSETNSPTKKRKSRFTQTLPKETKEVSFQVDIAAPEQSTADKPRSDRRERSRDIELKSSYRNRVREQSSRDSSRESSSRHRSKERARSRDRDRSREKRRSRDKSRDRTLRVIKEEPANRKRSRERSPRSSRSDKRPDSKSSSTTASSSSSSSRHSNRNEQLPAKKPRVEEEREQPPKRHETSAPIQHVAICNYPVKQEVVDMPINPMEIEELNDPSRATESVAIVAAPLVPETIPPAEKETATTTVEKKSEPLLTTFTGSLKLLDTEGMFVKINTNRTVAPSTSELTTEEKVPPAETAITRSDSEPRERESEIPLPLPLTLPLSLQTTDVDFPGSSPDEALNLTGSEHQPLSTQTAVQHQLNSQIVMEPQILPVNYYPHMNPKPSEDNLPLMVIPKDAVSIPPPEIPEEPIIEQPPPPPAIKMKLKINTIPAQKEMYPRSPEAEIEPIRESNLTVANLEKYNTEMEKDEIPRLLEEFRQTCGPEILKDPSMVASLKRRKEEEEKKKLAMERGLRVEANKEAASTIAPSHKNVDLKATKIVLRTDFKREDESVDCNDISLNQRNQPSTSLLTPQGPQKENANLNAAEGNTPDIKPVVDKCVVMRNSTYNFSTDADGTPVLVVNRKKKKKRTVV